MRYGGTVRLGDAVANMLDRGTLPEALYDHHEDRVLYWRQDLLGYYHPGTGTVTSAMTVRMNPGRWAPAGERSDLAQVAGMMAATS